MANEPTPDVTPDAAGPRCPWCSASLPEAGLAACPTCGASLTESESTDVPGLTKIDPEAILRSRTPSQKSRGLIGWLSGEYREQPAGVAEPAATFAPPDEEVRREMLRMELVALEAQADAQRAEMEVELAEAARAKGAANSAGDPASDPAFDPAAQAEIVELDEHAI